MSEHTARKDRLVSPQQAAVAIPGAAAKDAARLAKSALPRRLWIWRHRRHDLILRYRADGADFICRRGHTLPALSTEVRL